MVRLEQSYSVTLHDELVVVPVERVWSEEYSKPSLMDGTCSVERHGTVERQKTCQACSYENAGACKVSSHLKY